MAAVVLCTHDVSVWSNCQRCGRPTCTSCGAKSLALPCAGITLGLQCCAPCTTHLQRLDRLADLGGVQIRCPKHAGVAGSASGCADCAAETALATFWAQSRVLDALQGLKFHGAGPRRVEAARAMAAGAVAVPVAALSTVRGLLGGLFGGMITGAAGGALIGGAIGLDTRNAAARAAGSAGKAIASAGKGAAGGSGACASTKTTTAAADAPTPKTPAATAGAGSARSSRVCFPDASAPASAPSDMSGALILVPTSEHEQAGIGAAPSRRGVRENAGAAAAAREAAAASAAGAGTGAAAADTAASSSASSSFAAGAASSSSAAEASSSSSGGGGGGGEAPLLPAEEELARVVKCKNAYEILGVPASASASDIKAAYRRRSRHYHPDRNPSPAAKDVASAINNAYMLLGDEEKRRAYDASSYKDTSGIDLMGGITVTGDGIAVSILGGAVGGLIGVGVGAVAGVALGAVGSVRSTASTVANIATVAMTAQQTLAEAIASRRRAIAYPLHYHARALGLRDVRLALEGGGDAAASASGGLEARIDVDLVGASAAAAVARAWRPFNGTATMAPTPARPVGAAGASGGPLPLAPDASRYLSSRPFDEPSVEAWVAGEGFKINAAAVEAWLAALRERERMESAAAGGGSGAGAEGGAGAATSSSTALSRWSAPGPSGAVTPLQADLAWLLPFTTSMLGATRLMRAAAGVVAEETTPEEVATGTGTDAAATADAASAAAATASAASAAGIKVSLTDAMTVASALGRVLGPEATAAVRARAGKKEVAAKEERGKDKDKEKDATGKEKEAAGSSSGATDASTLDHDDPRLEFARATGLDVSEVEDLVGEKGKPKSALGLIGWTHTLVSKSMDKARPAIEMQAWQALLRRWAMWSRGVEEDDEEEGAGAASGGKGGKSARKDGAAAAAGAGAGKDSAAGTGAAPSTGASSTAAASPAAGSSTPSTSAGGSGTSTPAAATAAGASPDTARGDAHADGAAAPGAGSGGASRCEVRICIQVVPAAAGGSGAAAPSTSVITASGSRRGLAGLFGPSSSGSASPRAVDPLAGRQLDDTKWVDVASLPAMHATDSMSVTTSQLQAAAADLMVRPAAGAPAPMPPPAALAVSVSCAAPVVEWSWRDIMAAAGQDLAPLPDAQTAPATVAAALATGKPDTAATTTKPVQVVKGMILPASVLVAPAEPAAVVEPLAAPTAPAPADDVAAPAAVTA